MEAILSLILSSSAVFAAIYLLPGVEIDSNMTAIIIAVIIGLMSAFIHPAIVLFSLPKNILCTGLVTMAIMPFFILILSYLIPGFMVDSLLWAVLFSLILAIINCFVHSLELL